MTPNSGRAYGRASLERALGAVIDRERIFAALVFKVAVGYPLGPDETVEPRHELVEGLVEDYARLGLTSGPHHAEQLIRDIETQATAQAERYRPPPR